MRSVTSFDYIIVSISTPGAVGITQKNKFFESVSILLGCLSEAGGVGVLAFGLWLLKE